MGIKEETYYTFSYSPVPNDKGGSKGSFARTLRILIELLANAG